MKKLLGILVLGLLWCTPSLTDDIRDFQIEGIGLDRSLTNAEIEIIFKKFKLIDKDFKITEKSDFGELGIIESLILEAKLAHSDIEKDVLEYAVYYIDIEEDDISKIKYETIVIKKGTKYFDELQITIASLKNTNQRSIVNVAGIHDFDSINKCIELKKEIENDIIDMFGGAKRGKDKYSSQSYDVSGRSKIIETDFLISNPETTGNITLYCYDWDIDIVEKHDWKNKLVLNIKLTNIKLNPPSGPVEFVLPSSRVKNVFEQISFIKKNKKFHTDDKYYALLIANSDYENWDDLKSPINDVDAIASELINNYSFEVEILKDADRNDILNKLYEYSNKISDNDNLLIYYAGHGELLSNNNAFWIPQDGTKKISSNWLNTSDVNSAISLIKAKDLLVMVDSCYQGTAFKGNEKNIENEKIQSKDDEYFKKMVTYRSAIVLTSGRNERVVDAMVDSHSPFAFKFLDILKKNDKFETGTSIFLELQKYHADVKISQSPNIIRKIDWHDLGGEFVFVKKNSQ